MLKVYKPGNVELSEVAFTVRADTPKPVVIHRSQPKEREAGDGESENDELMLSDDGPITLDPQEVEAILEEAQQRAAKIITDARRKADEESDAIRIAAQQEANNLRNDAYLEGQSTGFAEGAAAKVNQIEECISHLEEVVAEMEGGFSGFISEYESNLKWAVVEVSSKVLGKTIERDELELVDLVKDAVDQVKTAEWIDLHLCRDSVELIERIQSELAPLRQLEVIPDDLPAGSCLLDIPSGKLDASIDAQLDNLREYFKSHTLEL